MLQASIAVVKQRLTFRKKRKFFRFPLAFVLKGKRVNGYDNNLREKEKLVGVTQSKGKRQPTCLMPSSHPAMTFYANRHSFALH